MKLQDVILKAMAKKITWLEAAEIIGVCDRTMRRMRKQYEEFGYNGLFDQRRRKRIYLRVPMETAERVLALYRDTYFDLSVRHFHEKLREEHAIEISYTWVKQALQGAGLVARRKKRGSHRRRRPRRPMPGMLLHIDGSKHRWFSDERYYDLLVILDDATSEIYYAQLVEEESTRTVMSGLREVIETKGLFCALYSDRGSHFFLTRKAGEKVDRGLAGGRTSSTSQSSSTAPCSRIRPISICSMQHAIQTAFYGIAAVGILWAVYMIFSNPITQRIAEDHMVAARKADENAAA